MYSRADSIAIVHKIPTIFNLVVKELYCTLRQMRSGRT
jgi:hypothetical protein